jgi:hypothetical protein
MTKRGINRPNYPAWIRLQIEALNPGQWFVIPAHVTPTLNEFNFRTMLSARNRRYNVHLVMHIDQKEWWVWYSPDARPMFTGSGKVGLVTQAQELRGKILSLVDADDIAGAAQVQMELDAVKAQLVVSRKRVKLYSGLKTSIAQPLSKVLEHLKLTKRQWEAINPRERVKMMVAAEVEMAKLA